jgi:Ankyrin repeats (many copies)
MISFRLILTAIALVLNCTLGVAGQADYKHLLQVIESGEAQELRQTLKSLKREDLSYSGRVSMMIAALSSRDVDVLSTLLDWGISPDLLLIIQSNSEFVEMSPLLFAVSAKSGAQIADLLIRRGADVNPRGYDLLPLNHAISLRQYDTANLLIDAGALVNNPDSLAGLTPLIELVFSIEPATRDQGMALMSQLFAKGAKVNALSKSGASALSVAVALRKLEVVKALLEAKADPNLRNKKGQTPLQLATDKGFGDIAELLRTFGAKS